MKIHKNILTENQEEIVQDIVCNICGEKIPKNDFGYFDDFIEINKTWGYHSHMDGETHEIDICLACYKQLLSKMKIKPTVCEPE